MNALKERNIQVCTEIYTNEDIKQYLVENPHATCLELLKYDESTIRKRFHATNFNKGLEKLIQHKLSDDNKIRCLTNVNSLSARNANESFIDLVLTCEEKWLDCDNSRLFG